jgi:hypothetical protein
MISESVLDSLVAALDVRSRHGATELAPIAVLWPDETRQWQPIIGLIRDRRLVLELGDYDADALRGPAYWIRGILDGEIIVPIPTERAVPIVYLPGYARSDIRAVEEADARMKPLAELQYRGTIFAQQNGRDWTLAAFLESKQGGLGVEVADDQATKDALLRARVKLVARTVDELRKRAPLKAPFFDSLLAPDLDREVLQWLDDSAAFRSDLNVEQWDAFRSQFADRFGIGLEEGEIALASQLGRRAGPWESVWRRYSDAPGRYPTVEQRLRDAAPKRTREEVGLFDGPLGSWPQDNSIAEDRLRRALIGVASMGSAAGADQLVALERDHGDRRNWVWGALGKAPLAMASEHLASLAACTGDLLPPGPVARIVDGYVESAWRADDAVMRALAAATTKADRDAITGAVRAVYVPWLDESVRRFQEAVGEAALDYVVEPLVAWPVGTCLVFIDGLRFDVAKRLEASLTGEGLEVAVRPRLTALPTITPTAKPAVSPILARLGPGNGLGPAPKDGGADLTVAGLRSLLAAEGYHVLFDGETGDPEGRAWTEHGDIDELGHKQEAKLPALLDGEVRSLGERVAGLIAAGWQQVVVLTDHGWLYVPGGLPKVELPYFLTKDERMRKGRTGRLADGATAPGGTVPWFWDPSVRMAVAPGIATFVAGAVYEHGGVSPQECVTPVITVRAAAAPRGPVALTISWRGLRADVTASGAPSGASVDLRRKAGDPSTSLLAGPVIVSPDATARILVVREDAIDAVAFLVVVAQGGGVIAQETVTVGGER